MTKSPSEKDQEKKLVTRVSMETYEALKAFSEGESRWEARVLRRVIKEWLALQMSRQGIQQHGVGKAVIVAEPRPFQSHTQKIHKTGT